MEKNDLIKNTIVYKCIILLIAESRSKSRQEGKQSARGTHWIPFNFTMRFCCLRQQRFKHWIHYIPFPYKKNGHKNKKTSLICYPQHLRTLNHVTDWPIDRIFLLPPKHEQCPKNIINKRLQECSGLCDISQPDRQTDWKVCEGSVSNRVQWCRTAPNMRLVLEKKPKNPAIFMPNFARNTVPVLLYWWLMSVSKKSFG